MGTELEERIKFRKKSMSLNSNCLFLLFISLLITFFSRSLHLSIYIHMHIYFLSFPLFHSSFPPLFINYSYIIYIYSFLLSLDRNLNPLWWILAPPQKPGDPTYFLSWMIAPAIGFPVEQLLPNVLILFQIVPAVTGNCIAPSQPWILQRQRDPADA